MICVIQRVKHSQLHIEGALHADISQGLLALVGLEKGDDERSLGKMLDKLLAYRVFADAEGKMNLSLRDIAGDLLLVSQFTLAADTSRGNRPGFSTAAAPDEGKRLYEYFAAQLAAQGLPVETGQFGADMKVELLNDGPVTIWMES